MKPIVLTLFALASAPLPAAAQALVLPTKPLDAPRVKVRDALLVLRDSLVSVTAATARLQRDFRNVSGITLSARARSVAAACQGSARTVVPTRQVIAAAPATPARVRAQAMLLHALDSLGAAMSRCGGDFGTMGQPGSGEEVRGYGNRRAEPVILAIDHFDRSFDAFIKAWEIEIRPLGARPNPIEG